MERFSKQITYTLSNIKDYYLSPYCEAHLIDDKICLERADLNRHLFFSCIDNNKMQRLFEKLTTGMSGDELMNYLTEELGETNPEDWVACCIQGGVIE